MSNTHFSPLLFFLLTFSISSFLGVDLTQKPFDVGYNPVFDSQSNDLHSPDDELQVIWTSTKLQEFLSVIKSSSSEGFSPEDYGLIEIERLLEKDQGLISPELDTLLTQSFFKYIEHLSTGTVDQEKVYSLWEIEKTSVPHWELYCNLVKEESIYAVVAKYEPKLFEYRTMQQYAMNYGQVAIAGGWPQIEPGEIMRFGMEGERVAKLKRRLELTNEFDDLNQQYDCTVEEAVKRFQTRHGLIANGIVDESTLNALNVPVQERLAIILANMERIRWFGNTPKGKYFRVNIPAFEMKAMTDGTTDLKMRVAVGKKSAETPVFRSEMNHFVMNPYWIIPPTILNRDIIPKIRKQSDYLKKSRIKVMTYGGQQINPDSVNWEAATEGAFPYMLRQEPGRNNALGQIKFIFPNKFNIYMHDTNHPNVFKKRNLARSAGCIRLSEPLKLAKHLNNDLPSNTTNVNVKYPLEKNIPVYIAYQTAFIDENGNLNFREDIYDKDEKLINALAAKDCSFNSNPVL